MNSPIDRLHQLKLDESELIEQVCTQLEKDCALNQPLARPTELLQLIQIVLPQLIEALKLKSANEIRECLYRIDLPEEKGSQISEPSQLAELVMNRCFQKIYLRNQLKV